MSIATAVYRRVFMFAILPLIALPVGAQTSPYVQSGSINAAAYYPASAGCAESGISYNWTPQPSYTCTLRKPITSPCTVVVDMRYPNAFSDSLGTKFVIATNNSGRYDELWYSTSCPIGTDAFTFTGGQQADIVVYAGVWVPDQVSTEVVNITGTDAWANPVTPSVNGALVLTFGNNHTLNSPGITGANGFTLRENANQFVADLVQTTAAPIAGEVTYSAPVNWCQYTISFKPGGPPPPFKYTLTGFGTFTFPMQAPPDCSAGGCSLVACNTTLQPNVCVTLTPGQNGSLVIRKPSGDTTVVSVGP